MKREQRNTLLLALALLAVLGAALFLQRLLLRGEDGAPVWAVVDAAGREPRRLPLTKDVEFQVGDEQTGYNLVRVEDGKIMVAEADCADKVCVYTGAISLPGEFIACLPHGLFIYIEEAGEQN